MKKLVASVLTLVMLFSCIPGFAAVTVTPMSGTDTIAQTVYSCKTLTVGGDVDYVSFVGGLTTGSPAPTQTANEDGTATITQVLTDKEENGSTTKVLQKTETYLFFGYNKSVWMDSNMSFGYDIKFENVTVADTSNYVMTTNIGANTPQMPDHGTSKTAWHFYKKGSKDMTCYVDNDGYIKMGNATMTQGETYTVKVWINATNKDAKTFVVTVTDKDGNTQVAVADGTAQNIFQGFGKINFTISANTQVDSKVTVGNTFVNYNDPYGLGLVADENLAVSDDGTVAVAIRVPSGYTDAKLYVNDAWAEDVTLTDGVTDYTATVQLPEATTAGEATLKLEAKNGGNTESVTQTVTLTKEYAVTKENVSVEKNADSTKKATNEEDTSAYGSINLTVPEDGYELNPNQLSQSYGSKGVYETSVEIKNYTEKKTSDMYFMERLTYSSAGKAIVLSGTENNGDESYHKIILENSGKVGTEELVADKWNQIKVRVDYDKNTWAYYLNGKEAASGTLASKDLYPTFYRLRYNMKNVVIRNVKVNQVMDAPKVEKVVAGYTDGSTADATSTTISSVNLNKLTFTASEAITLGTKGAKILDANGTAVENLTWSTSNKEITATYSGDTLTDGTYKLVICGDATFSGNKLGLAVTKDFTLTADSVILSPANNSTVSGDTVAISVYAKDAGTMRICVDDAKICDDFAVTAGEFVNKTYTLTANGPKQVQVYLFSGDNVTALTSAFTVANTSIGNEFEGTDFTNQSGEAGVVWNTSNPLAGRACFEGDITPHQTDKKIRVEIGSVTDGTNNTSESDGRYITLQDALGWKTKDGGTAEALFNDNGKLYNTEIAYEANKTYHIKYVIDYENDTYEFYVDGKLIATKKSTENSNSLKAATNWHAKFRFSTSKTSDEDKGTADYKNFVAYEEYIAPQIDNINSYTMSENGYYPVKTASKNYIGIQLDKKYASLSGYNITIKADGEVLDMSDVNVNYDPDKNAITLTNYQSLVKPGQILTVTIDANATVSVPDKGAEPTTIVYKTVPAGVALEANLIVLDATRESDFAVLPLQKVTANGKTYAYSRWIKAGASVDAKLILADYEAVGTDAKRLSKASVTDVTVGGTENTVGVATGCIDSTEATVRAFLWTTDTLTPLTD